MMIGITLLGSTGSIGKNTLDILAQYPDRFRVIALTAKSNVEILLNQCLQFKPHYAVMADALAAHQLRQQIHHHGLKTEVLEGEEALEQVVILPETHYVLAAIVGGAGLLPTLAAARTGKRILLANKEALVMAGSLFMNTVNEGKATLLPVDSEHNAIFQSMPAGYVAGTCPEEVRRIILTASGGPFRTLNLSQFEDITPAQAIKHPNWNMGAKISVDSATMMNKGLEVIEACWLFNLNLDKIEVLLHPQSTIHSLVEYYDGSFLAQLGSPDMRIPIAHTLAWPSRMKVEVKTLDLIEQGQLTFEKVDLQRFPCLQLAYDALSAGGTAATILNAANEVAVQAFLEHKIAFLKISEIIAETLQAIPSCSADSLQSILDVDAKARRFAEKQVGSL